MRTETIIKSDLEAIGQLKPDDWGDIIPEFEFYLATPFCYPLKIVLEDKLAGVGVAVVFENTAWLAHIIVDKEMRNRGIGARIVAELVDLLNNHSIESCLLTATSLGRPVYEKAGFRTVGEYLFLKRETPWKAEPLDANIVPYKEDWRAQIYDLDQKAAGENRIRLTADFLADSFVYRKQDKITGFYLPELRDGLIVADTPEAGLALMNLKYATVDKAALPSTNTMALAFLKERGFVETGITAPRMVLGKDIPWRPDMIYGRIGGNFG